MTDFSIDSEAGRIGQFWWFNSNGERLWMGNQWPWVRKWCIRWGTFGFGRNVRIYMEPLDD